ncbi:MAG: hypothetical protein ACTHQQ_13390 [Solirubrobacteraceae bacterium]
MLTPTVIFSQLRCAAKTDWNRRGGVDRDEAVGARAQRRFRMILQPEGWGDELRATFISAGRCRGFICMHRDRPGPSFSPGDSRLLARLVPHLGDGLRKSLLIDPTATAFKEK